MVYVLLISNGEARLTGLMTVAANRWAAQAGMDTDRVMMELRQPGQGASWSWTRTRTSC